MSNKEKLVDLLIIGTGLSSLTFIDAYLERKKKIEVISPEIDFNNKIFHEKNNHIFKILPPQMFDKENKVKAYFQLNNIFLKKNCKIFGSLEFGGLSNYWGLQIDPNISDDLQGLKIKTKKKILKCFFEIMGKLQLIGKFKIKKKTLDFSLKKNDFFDFSIIKDKKIKISDLILGFENKKNKNRLDNINEQKDKLVPQNYFKKYLKNKNIIFHNYFVKKIRNHRNGVELICFNGKIEKKIVTKKLVLGCGTIISTKLIAEYLNYRKEIKLRHHPRLLTLFFLKKRLLNNMNFQPPLMHIKPRLKQDLFTTDFRSGNKLIINSIIKLKKYLYPFKFILNFLRFNFLFLNTFLNPKFSNIYLKLNNNGSMNIYSKNKNIKKIFSKSSSLIYAFFRKTKKIFPFQINYFPGYGADFHYFGTLQMNGKGKLSVNEDCQLKINKKIYIIDGSVLNCKKNKYPLGLMLANSRRIAKELLNKSR
jgi:hypothetical protein